MEMDASEPLLMPSFLYGAYASVDLKAYEEGLRCGARYRQDGTFPEPLEMRLVAPDQLVIMKDVVDFQHVRPVWRPYLMSRLKEGLWESLDWAGADEVGERYEAFCRGTAWGALYYALGPSAPRSAERTAARLQALLRFWSPLQSVRYLWKTFKDEMTLDDLMGACCHWAMDAWCPEEHSSSVRSRLSLAADRMARATREESIEVILRQLPRTLLKERHLKHRERMMDPVRQRKHLSTLSPEFFQRVSAACTGELGMTLTMWDRQLEKQQ